MLSEKAGRTVDESQSHSEHAGQNSVEARLPGYDSTHGSMIRSRGKLAIVQSGWWRVIERWIKDWSSFIVFVTVLGLIIQWQYPFQEMRWGAFLSSYRYLLRGLGLSWVVTLASFGLSIVPAIVLAFARSSKRPMVRYPAMAVIETIRTTPELMIVFWIFFAVPLLTGRHLDAFSSGVVSLTLVNCAYLAEGIRAGIQAVPSGQYMAGLASGLTPFQAKKLVVLPQALRNMLPEIRNRVVSLFKTSSILYIIGLVEFFRAITIVNNREFTPFAAFITAGLGYFVCCYVFDVIGQMIEAKTQIRRGGW